MSFFGFGSPASNSSEVQDLLSQYKQQNNVIKEEIRPLVDNFNRIVSNMVVDRNGRWEIVTESFKPQDVRALGNADRRTLLQNIESLKGALKSKVSDLKTSYEGYKVESLRNASSDVTLFQFAKAMSYVYFIKLLVVLFIYAQNAFVLSFKDDLQQQCDVKVGEASVLQARIQALESELATVRGQLNATRNEVGQKGRNANALSQELNAVKASKQQGNVEAARRFEEQQLSFQRQLQEKDAEIAALRANVNAKSTCSTVAQERLEQVLNANQSVLRTLTDISNAASSLLPAGNANKNARISDFPEHNFTDRGPTPAKALTPEDKALFANLADQLKTVKRLLHKAEDIQKTNTQLRALLADAIPIMANFSLTEGI